MPPLDTGRWTTLNDPVEANPSMPSFPQHPFTLLINTRFQPGEPYGAHRSSLLSALAQAQGCSCVIYIHATVGEGRKDAIARYCAQVVLAQGASA
jgi:hypothetical protein